MLILSLPGVILEKDEQDFKSDLFPVSEETLESWAETWKVFDDRNAAHSRSLSHYSGQGKLRHWVFQSSESSA